MKVVSIDPREKEEARRKADMLEVLEAMKEQIEAGHIKEFVAASLDAHGVPQIHASCLDLTGGIGLFEIGKVCLVNQLLNG